MQIKRNMINYIPDSIKTLHKIFTENGYKLYLVGGSVRDFIIGTTPKDFDLATDATPDQIIQIVSDYKTNLQGKAFGVVVVTPDDYPEGYEIATFREDIYNETLGETRFPTVKYSTIENDCLRRDLRINALYYDLETKQVIDLVNGIEDINNRVIKFVGIAEQRIIEDPLRILRCLRFSTRFGYDIDINNKKEISKHSHMLSIISRERIFDEIKKAYKQSINFKEYLDLITELNLWKDIFNDVTINTDVIETNSIVTYLTNLFRYEKISILEERFPNFTIDNDTSNKILFLLSLNIINANNVFDLYKKKQQYKIDNNLLIEWFRISDNKTINAKKFLNYTPTTITKNLIELGYNNKELGIKIREIETKKFIEIKI